MQNFGIRFLICNLILIALTGILVCAKRLLKNQLSPGLQYYLCIPYFILLSVPFLPLSFFGFSFPVSRSSLFQWLSAFINSLQPASAQNLPGISSMTASDSSSVIRDFAVSVNSVAPGHWNLILLSFWITGAAITLLLFFHITWKFHKIKCSASLLEKPEIQKIFSDCCTELHIRRKILVFVSPKIHSPVTTCFLKPRIFIPADLDSVLQTHELRYMFLHELQHCRRLDGLVNDLCTMFRIIYWFNPAVILVLKKIPLERELACDASVLTHLSAEDYPLYGASLLNLAEKLSSYPSASGMVSKGSQLRRRILGITSFRHRNRKQKWKSVISYLLISVLTAGMIPVLSAYAGSEETVSLHGKTTENLELSTDFHGFDGSFVLYDSQTGLWKIYRPELAIQRFSPASTFKIYSALHGLEKGIISPECSFMKWDGTPCAFPRWEQDQTLDSAMKDSVNWYFQNMDQLLGRTEISSFLKKINYGNKQISKDLKLYWADDSLKISAVEQVELLQNFYTNTFDCSEQNIQAVKDALRVGEFSGGTLYGKTGTIQRNNRDISGWFVGFVETDDNVLYFAANIQGTDHADGSQAAAIARSVLSSKIFI